MKKNIVLIFSALIFAGVAAFAQEKDLDGTFIAYYQPLVSAKTGKVVGAEVLSRMVKQGNVESPYKYLDYVKQTDMLKEFDLFMFSEACKTAKKFSKGKLFFTVNFTKHTLSLKGIAEEIKEEFEKYGISKNSIGIEITEGDDYEDFELLKANIASLKNSGFIVYVDDFGAQGTQESDLYDFRPAVLKLDRKAYMLSGDAEEKICAVTAKAHSLKMKVIAEGVESDKDEEILRKCSVEYGQGYYYGKPMSLESFTEKVSNKKAAAENQAKALKEISGFDYNDSIKKLNAKF